MRRWHRRERKSGLQDWMQCFQNVLTLQLETVKSLLLF